jgi:hypothetical protein
MLWILVWRRAIACRSERGPTVGVEGMYMYAFFDLCSYLKQHLIFPVYIWYGF